MKNGIQNVKIATPKVLNNVIPNHIQKTNTGSMNINNQVNSVLPKVESKTANNTQSNMSIVSALPIMNIK